LIEKTLSKLSSVVSASGWGSTIPAPAKRMSNFFFLADPRVEPVEIGEVRDIGLDGRDIAADLGDGLVKLGPAAAGDVDERSFLNEALGGGEAYPAAAARDDGYLSFKFRHRCFPQALESGAARAVRGAEVRLCLGEGYAA
jgi:hypothetical protein